MKATVNRKSIDMPSISPKRPSGKELEINSYEGRTVFIENDSFDTIKISSIKLVLNNLIVPFCHVPLTGIEIEPDGCHEFGPQSLGLMMELFKDWHNVVVTSLAGAKVIIQSSNEIMDLPL